MAQAIFVEMFDDPLANVRGFDTGPLAEFIDPARPITYGILMPGPDHPGGVSYVRVVDMAGGTINLDTVRKTSPEIARQYDRSRLRSGDLLISIRGHVGRVVVTPPELDGGNITQDTARLAVKGLDPNFVQGMLETQSARDWMARRTKGAAVQGLNLGDLKKLPMICPPKALQREYAQRVVAIRRLSRDGKTQSQQLDSLFAALQHRAFNVEL